MKIENLKKKVNKYYIFIILIALAFVLGTWYGNGKVKIEEKIKVVKVKEVIHQETEIVEKPDGTKITKIVTDSKKSADILEKSKKIEKKINKKWLFHLYASKGPLLGRSLEPTFGIGLSYKVLPWAFMGVYGHTDGNIGLSLTLSF